MEQNKGALSIVETAEYTGLSESFVRRKVSDGTIPAFKIGDRWLISRFRLDEWLKSQGQGNTPAKAC
jgi:excisionase family DNA binding protein